MLSIVGFQARKVSFQTVGSGRNVRVVEIVEHVGQSAQKHAAGALDVAEDPTGFFSGSYLGTMLGFPDGDKPQKFLSIHLSNYTGDPQEHLS